MTKVVFETATIADAIKKASRVAPSRGKAFDQAAGIVIELVGGDNPVAVIRATDTAIFSMEWVNIQSFEGEPATWRIPSTTITTFLSSLPIGTGKIVTMEEVPNGNFSILKIWSGRSQMKCNIMDDSTYPIWEAFDPDGLETVIDFGGRVAMVEWAAATKPNPPLDGVHFTGAEVMATDRYSIASMPLPIPALDSPVTVPGGILGQVINKVGETRIRVTEHELLVMPDEATQLRCTRYATAYPNVNKIRSREREHTITFERDEFLAMIARVSIAGAADRNPMLRLFIGAEEVAAILEGTESMAVLDCLELEGQATHDRIEIRFSPKVLSDPIAKSESRQVSIGYNVSTPNKIVYINGGGGYEAWIAPRSPQATD